MNRIFVILLIFGCFLSLEAQVGEHRNDFSVGISAGCSMNRVSFSPRIKQQFKISPQFGFATRYVCEKYFNSICAVQVELNYQNLGWKELIEDGSGNQYTRNLSFLQLPLLMQMGWGRERRGLKFLFEAGPVLHYYVGQSESRVGEWDTSHRPNGVVYQYDHEIDNKVSYGIEAGLGVEFSSAIGHFLLEGRYDYGLGDLYDNSKKGFFGRSANSTIEVKLTYLFDIIKTKY